MRAILAKWTLRVVSTWSGDGHFPASCSESQRQRGGSLAETSASQYCGEATDRRRDMGGRGIGSTRGAVTQRQRESGVLLAQAVSGGKIGHEWCGSVVARSGNATCRLRGQKVGAAIVVEDRIVSTGYNGTPTKMVNCSDRGCVRRLNREKKYPSGTGYDLCICVHAEQNAIISA